FQALPIPQNESFAQRRLHGLVRFNALPGRRLRDAFFVPSLPIAPDAANPSRRRNFGHSIWLGAEHTAACLRPSRIADNFLMVVSSSSDLLTSNSLSILGFPPDPNMRTISSNENPAARPSAIKASRSNTLALKIRRKPCLPIELISPFSS